jgi:hypothetical protein
MRTEIFFQHLGEMSIGDLEKGLTIGSATSGMNLELIRRQCPQGLRVGVEFEIDVLDTMQEQALAMAGKSPNQDERKFIRVVLEPRQQQ